MSLCGSCNRAAQDEPMRPKFKVQMKRGRPKLKFFGDRDRHLMALALAYRALGMSMRGGCEAAVASTEGLPVGLNLNRGHGGHGLNLLDWRYDLKRRPGAAATIQGRARGLRQKLKGYLRNEPAARWLYQMSKVFLFAMQPAAEPDPAAAERVLLAMADLVGEAGYVRERLVPLMRMTRARPERPQQ